MMRAIRKAVIGLLSKWLARAYSLSDLLLQLFQPFVHALLQLICALLKSSRLLSWPCFRRPAMTMGATFNFCRSVNLAVHVIIIVMRLVVVTTLMRLIVFIVGMAP